MICPAARRIETNGLTGLEVASEVVLGRDEPPPREPAHGSRDPLAVLEGSLRKALLRPPCLVAFSGGRDSSALLAVAAGVARREGLPPPVPVTLRFGEAPETREDEWQALAIEHLGLRDWIRLDFTDELDLLGPVATALMARDGLSFPSNLHLLVPLMEAARGGSLVTGHGGDQAMTAAGRALDVLARRLRPSARDAARIAVGLGPAGLRRAALRSRVGLTFPWLRPQANALLDRSWLDEQVRWPFRWDARLVEVWRSRVMWAAARRIDSLATHTDTVAHSPLAAADFVFALAAHGGATGFAGRTAAMRALFGDLLPPDLICRASKASFDEVLWSTHTRAFVEGIDEEMLGVALADLDLAEIVDAGALAAHWQGPSPLGNSFLLVQACALALRPTANEGIAAIGR